MTTEQFMQDLESYYGVFINDLIARRYYETANKLKAESVAAVFEWLVCNVPVAFKLDIKTLQEALQKCCVTYKETLKACPCCGENMRQNQPFCYSCGFDFSCPPENYEPANKAEVQNFLQNLKVLRYNA